METLQTLSQAVVAMVSRNGSVGVEMEESGYRSVGFSL